ncbi:tetratricopeptide repeat protein, partial [Pseudomonadota bacterium]
KELGLREALKKDPTDAAAHQGLGEVLLSQRRVKEAKESLQKAIKYDPVRGLAYALLGELAEHDKDLDKAIDFYQKALGTVIDNYKAVDSIQKKLMMALGNRFFIRNEYEDAELAYIDVLEKYGPDRSVLWKLALVTNRQLKNDIAKEYYYQLLEIAPDYLTARYNLGLLFEQEEEEDLAIAEYRRITLSDIDNPRLKDMATNRIKMIKRMINGLSYSVGYSISINDNTNSARVGKLAEYSSSTSATVTYNYKIKKGMRFSLNISPSYSISHLAQSDGFNLGLSPNLSFKWKEKNWRVGLTRSTSSSVLRPEGRSSRSEVINGSVSWPGEGSINYSSRFSYTGFGSTKNPFFDANTYTGGINMSMVGKNQIPLSFGYTMTINQNRGTLGNDNAYVGHSVNGRLDYRLPGGFVGNVNSNIGLLAYTNPDSYSGFTKKRITLSFGLGTGLSYRVNSSLSFYGNYNYTVQRSNLPVGFILNRDQVIEGVQSAGLGAIERNSIGFGMSISL